MENENDITPGLICKSAEVQTQDVSDEDLKKINKFALSPLTKEEVFTFKIIMGDNEIDDRNYEPFNLNALKDLKKLYIGKTMIKDHRRLADNQIARVYDTELLEDETKMTGSGERFTKLIAKAYMIKTASNSDLISEIKAGIKKEVSTGCRPKHAYCSICGTDNTKSYCPHWGGREYDTKDGKKICYFTLDGAKEAFEVSFVAVPAQPRAGTTKNYGATTKSEEKTEEDTTGQNETDNKTEDEQNNKNVQNLESTIEVKLKEVGSFLFEKNLKEDL